MTISKLILALLLSILIPLALAATYSLYPLAPIFWHAHMPGSENHGAVAASGGIRASTLLITECLVFAILFVLSYRSRTSA